MCSWNYHVACWTQITVLFVCNDDQAYADFPKQTEGDDTMTRSLSNVYFDLSACEIMFPDI